MVSKYLLLAVIFSGLVTWVPRMIPFILVKYKGLPAIVERFLKFLPVSIIFALSCPVSPMLKQASCQVLNGWICWPFFQLAMWLLSIRT